MNKKISNFFSMGLAVSHFYDKYKTQLDANPILARLFAEFFSYFVVMQEAVQVQKGYTSEATKQKLIEEDEMIEATVRNANKGFVYATEQKLPGLLETFNVSSWTLKKMSDVTLHSTCLNVYTTLRGIAPEAIAEYGIVAADLTLLKKEIDDFYALISVPRSNIITRSQATQKVEEQRGLLQLLFTQRLDKMIDSLPNTDKVLKNEYKAARTIIDRSSNGGDEGDNNTNDAPTN